MPSWCFSVPSFSTVPPNRLTVGQHTWVAHTVSRHVTGAIRSTDHRKCLCLSERDWVALHNSPYAHWTVSLVANDPSALPHSSCTANMLRGFVQKSRTLNRPLLHTRDSRW